MHDFRAYILPKLPPPAARSLCDSWATCLVMQQHNTECHSTAEEQFSVLLVNDKTSVMNNSKSNWNTSVWEFTSHGALRSCAYLCLRNHLTYLTAYNSYLFNNDFPWLLHEQKMNFHDLSAQHIFLKLTIHDLRMLTRIKIFPVSNYKQDGIYWNKNSSAFLQKIPGHHHPFPRLFMTFHDLGCFPWLSRPGKWSY